jgi:hypothetical protein
MHARVSAAMFTFGAEGVALTPRPVPVRPCGFGFRAELLLRPLQPYATSSASLTVISGSIAISTALAIREISPLT